MHFKNGLYHELLHLIGVFVHKNYDWRQKLYCLKTAYALCLCQFNIVISVNTQRPLIYLSQCYNTSYAFFTILFFIVCIINY